MSATIEVWADTRGRGRCRGINCGAAGTWYETLAGKKMLFTGEPVALTTRRDESSGRLIEALDFEAVHWRSCPDWLAFKTRK
jgi:hypothetical protein